MRAVLGRFTMALLVVLAVVIPPVLGIFSWLPTSVKTIALVALVVIAIVRDYRQNISPHVDFLRKRRYFFELACVRAIEGLRKFDDKARLNVLEIQYRLPRKRWGIFKPIFQLYMEGAPDVHLGMRIDQGVSGEAVRRQRSYAHNLEAP